MAAGDRAALDKQIIMVIMGMMRQKRINMNGNGLAMDVCRIIWIQSSDIWFEDVIWPTNVIQSDAHELSQRWIGQLMKRSCLLDYIILPRFVV